MPVIWLGGCRPPYPWTLFAWVLHYIHVCIVADPGLRKQFYEKTAHGHYSKWKCNDGTHAALCYQILSYGHASDDSMFWDLSIISCQATFHGRKMQCPSIEICCILGRCRCKSVLGDFFEASKRAHYPGRIISSAEVTRTVGTQDRLRQVSETDNRCCQYDRAADWWSILCDIVHTVEAQSRNRLESISPMQGPTARKIDIMPWWSLLVCRHVHYGTQDRSASCLVP